MKAILFGDEFGLEIFEKTVIPIWEIGAIVTADNKESAITKAKYISDKYNIPHLIQPSRGEAEGLKAFYNTLRDCKPDLIFVNSYSRILPKELLDIPGIGSFNIHDGLLPEYRGRNAINWALVNGEEETGVTIHKMTEQADAGPILLMQKLNIGFADTAAFLKEKAAFATERVIMRAIPLFAKGNIRLYPQDEKAAHYWPERIPDEAEKIDNEKNSSYAAT